MEEGRAGKGKEGGGAGGGGIIIKIKYLAVQNLMVMVEYIPLVQFSI